jgi:predicted transcriptional regulator
MSTNVLLSIKPVFAERIFNGQKRYEFRKVIFRNTNVKKIYVYASSPISKVIGEFQIDGVLKMPPDQLWQVSCAGAGITREFFDSYFLGREYGYAIKIGRVHQYNDPLELRKHFNIKQAPQSFVYVPNSENSRWLSFHMRPRMVYAGD